MPCSAAKLPGGGVIITCGRGHVAKVCQVKDCHASGTQLCDWPIAKGRTCDLRMCSTHAHHVAHDVDYCQEHWAQREARAGR